MAAILIGIDCCPGSLARVSDPQTVLAEHVQVWVDYGTSNARKELLHGTALDLATSEGQAWTIERRRKEAWIDVSS